MPPLRFFDCNTFIGSPTNAALYRPESAESLLAAMDRAGIERALVWHIAQHDHDPITGNELLTAAIAPHPRLVGSWTLLPPQCGEIGDVSEWLAAAAQARVRAFRAFPAAGRYLLRSAVLGDLLDAFVMYRLPLILSIQRGVTWEMVYNLMAEYPDLTLIVADVDIWGPDRFFRPLIERYSRVYLDISSYLSDGGLEAFAEEYGVDRLLFGTGHPACYHGSAMLALAHAEIGDEEKQAVAGGNLDRLLEEALP